MLAEGQRWFLYRLVDGDKVEKVRVRLGFESPDRVEVLAGEGGSLASGERIVVAGTGALEDGALIEVMPDGSATPTLAAR